MTTLLEGHYKAVDHFYTIVEVSIYTSRAFLTCQLENKAGECRAADAGGEEFPLRVEYGHFGQADPAVRERTGLSDYNVKLIMRMGNKELVDTGILYHGGRRCVMKGFL